MILTLRNRVKIPTFFIVVVDNELPVLLNKKGQVYPALFVNNLKT